MPEPTPSLRRLRAAGRILALLLVLIGLGLVWTERHVLDAQSIALTLGRYRAAPAIFLALHTVASLIFFPRTVLAVAAGAVFGVWWGTFWAAFGSVLGALAGFLLARYVNSGLVDLEGMRRFGPVLLRAERGGWRAVAVLRLVPVIPHTLSNYALGLTRLDLGAYAVGSLLGQLPMTIACADLGAAGEEIATGKAGWLEPTLIGLAVLVVSVVLPRLAARQR
jgi:uncharacterized membrane protein YdjX (TVP38/TMEM64 family)